MYAGRAGGRFCRAFAPRSWPSAATPMDSCCVQTVLTSPIPPLIIRFIIRSNVRDIVNLFPRWTKGIAVHRLASLIFKRGSFWETKEDIDSSWVFEIEKTKKERRWRLNVSKSLLSVNLESRGNCDRAGCYVNCGSIAG